MAAGDTDKRMEKNLISNGGFEEDFSDEGWSPEVEKKPEIKRNENLLAAAALVGGGIFAVRRTGLK